MSIVLSNAGPLIALGKLNRLQLLADLYHNVQMTTVVVEVPSAVLDVYTPPVKLDPGEHELLSLAQTLAAPLVLLDDEMARTEARRLPLQVRGTLGVLVQAYRAQLLTFDHIELLIQEIAARPDIWISAKFCEHVLASLRL